MEQPLLYADNILDEEISSSFSSQILPEWESRKTAFITRDFDKGWSTIKYPHMLPIEPSPLDTSDIKYSMVGRGPIRYYQGKDGVLHEKCFSLNAVKMCPTDHKKNLHNFCLAWDCPRCWPLAAMRAGLRISERIQFIEQYYNRKIQFHHFTLSPPPDANILDYKKVYKKLKDGRWAMLRGAVIFRHFHRLMVDVNGTPVRWRWSPHFHIITDAIFHKTPEKLAPDDWIIKKLPKVSGDPLALELYEMGHSGFIFESEMVLKSVDPVKYVPRRVKNTLYRYWGRFAYNLWTREELIEKHDETCDACGLANISKHRVQKVVQQPTKRSDQSIDTMTYSGQISDLDVPLETNCETIEKRQIYYPNKRNTLFNPNLDYKNEIVKFRV